MQIDPETGSLSLGSLVLVPSWTRDELLVSEFGSKAEPRHYGTRPWIHYLVQSIQVGDHDFFVSVCCYEQQLVYCDLGVFLYPPEEHGWEHFSLEIEARTKLVHEQLLTDQLGKPTSGAPKPASGSAGPKEILDRTARWDFKWGGVASFHDPRSGNTSIRLAYGNRMAESTADYRSRQKAARRDQRSD